MLKGLLVVVVVPPLLNTAGLAREREVLQENLTRVDLGAGQWAWLQCEGRGQPIVLLEAGTGEAGDSWIEVQAALAPLTRVCRYDRAGLGHSDLRPAEMDGAGPGSREGSAGRLAGELSALLAAGVGLGAEPLVLVGRGLGASVVRLFAAREPERSVELVLVEPLPDTLFETGEPEVGGWVEHWARLTTSLRLLQLAAMLGLTRLGLLTGLLTAPTSTAKHRLCDPWHLQAVLAEHTSAAESARQARAAQMARPLVSPVTILTGSQYDPELPAALNTAWAAAVRRLADSLGPVCRLQQVEGELASPAHQATLLQPVVRAVQDWRARHHPGGGQL